MNPPFSVSDLIDAALTQAAAAASAQLFGWGFIAYNSSGRQITPLSRR